ncbi:MAG: GNAT family N-acetyltransferase, partial [Candidatus Latescibacteria bacterium]|nr:GNAT family N-acetyltransferase [Candidatus Latescibacterota bacterium]
DSFVVRMLIPELESRDAEVAVSELQMISHTSVPKDFDTFKAACNRRLRRQLSKAQKNFTDDEIQDITTGQTFQDGLDTLIALHQSRWNRMGFPGLFENPVFADLQHDLLPHMLERGWLWLKLIKKEEAPVAARLGFQFNGHFYDYITGFDTDAPCSKHGPGTALMIDMLEDAIECGGKSLDLLRGDESFKMEWMSESSHNSRMVLSVSSPSSVRQKLTRLMMTVNGLRYRLNHESTLIQVYYRQHGPLGFIRPYSKSRLSRFRNR